MSVPPSHNPWHRYDFVSLFLLLANDCSSYFHSLIGDTTHLHTTEEFERQICGRINSCGCSFDKVPQYLVETEELRRQLAILETTSIKSKVNFDSIAKQGKTRQEQQPASPKNDAPPICWTRVTIGNFFESTNDFTAFSPLQHKDLMSASFSMARFIPSLVVESCHVILPKRSNVCDLHPILPHHV